MICEQCGGRVTWRGPMSALTHTQCESCGGINCQCAEPYPADDDSSDTAPNYEQEDQNG